MSTPQVTSGSTLKCSFGDVPSLFVVLPTNRVTAGALPAATIMDHTPLLNVLPFGMCSSMVNPVVIAATAAALGTPTPAPCIPATATPWTPGAKTVTVGSLLALDCNCKLLCNWLGEITVMKPAQMTVTVP